MTINKDSADKLLETYGRAWEQQDSDLILTIFTDDATYKERALGTPMVGHEQIKKYWEEKVCAEQSDISFRVIRRLICKQTIIAEWRASFMSSIEGRVDLQEVALMDVDAESGKIMSLIEYFDMRNELTQRYLEMLAQGY